MSKQDLNSHCGTGRVGKEIELRHTKNNGTPVCDVSVAMNVGFGERQTTVWTRLTVWGKQAEFLAEYVSKGDLLAWTGAQYRVEGFQGSDGEEKKVHYFELNQGSQINSVGGKKDRTEEDFGGDGPAEPAQPANDPTDDW